MGNFKCRCYYVKPVYLLGTEVHPVWNKPTLGFQHAGRAGYCPDEIMPEDVGEFGRLLHMDCGLPIPKAAEMVCCGY